MKRDPLRLTVWNNGVVSVSSEGSDGAITRIETFPDGTVQAIESTSGGGRTLSIRNGTAIDTVILANGPGVFFDKADQAKDYEWFDGSSVTTKRPVKLPDGREGELTVTKDKSGHVWESGKIPQSVDAQGAGSPGRTWVRITHPPNDTLHPHSPRNGESHEMGRERYVTPGGKVYDHNYTIVHTRERDAMGRETTVHVGSGYSPATGEETRWSHVRAGDGSTSWTDVTRQTDGHWRIVTVTVDKDGHGTKHTTEGRGDEVTRDETTEAGPGDAGHNKGGGSGSSGDDGGDNSGGGEDSGGSGDDGDPDNDTDSPSGDGEGTSEGNPDAGVPFDSVLLSDLLGDDWTGDPLDTLGDVEAALRPWIDRILATARAGATGNHEELDALGAPPILGFDLSGYEEDELKDHDSLGRPRPIFQSLVEMGSALDAGRSVASLAELEHVAQGFTLAATTISGVLIAAPTFKQGPG